MHFGYMGQLLRVDLNNNKVYNQELSEDLLKSYVGGGGLGARLLYDETTENTGPFDDNNILMFITGPLVGTKFPSSSRYSIVTQSALGNYGEGDVGGSWAVELKKAGYDGIVISGKSEKPVYLYVNNGSSQIVDANELWGKDTYETDEILRRDTDIHAQVLSIGPAGEKLVKFSIILSEGKHARTGGRGGLGAIMGSKKLKAIVVKGDLKVKVAHEQKLKDLCQQLIPGIRNGTKNYTDLGTMGGLLPGSKFGVAPHKNWALGIWDEEKVTKISGPVLKNTIFTKNYFCKGCIIGCGKSIKITQGPYVGVEGGAPEYETLAAFGTLCLVDNLNAIAKANELCNRYGIDTISTGAAIAFTMEAFERGIIGESDLDGLTLNWGDADAMLEMTHKIGRREGFGKLLGEGVRYAANEIGGSAKEFAIEVKGLEPPMHDPRARGSMAIAYATDPRGASHSAKTYFMEKFSFSEFGYDKPLPGKQDLGKGIITSIMQDYAALFNSLKICHFVMPVVKPSDVVACLNAVTGWDMDLAEFMQAGERILNVQRMYNVRLGFNRKHDTIPHRLATMKFEKGGGAGYLPDLDKMLDEYYEHRKWSQEGIPLPSKLRQLSLKAEEAYVNENYPELCI